jgi:hypothetical protein
VTERAGTASMPHCFVTERAGTSSIPHMTTQETQ